MTGKEFAASLSRAACWACTVGSLAGAALAPAAFAETAPAKSSECLSGPKGAAPRGERWFYRVEHPGNRRCWYTRADAGRVAATQKPPSSPRAKISAAQEPAPPELASEAPAKPMLPSIANARAEASASLAPPPAAEAPREVPVKAAEPAAPTLADRWPDRAESPPAPTVRIMKVVPSPTADDATAPAPVAGTEAADESSWLEHLVDIVSVVLVLAGVAAVGAALFVRRRRRSADDEEFQPLIGANGDAVATWYEPPMDRLRMARHMADLPRPAR